MSETPSQPRTTPARRRQGRNVGRSGAQKAYASENDAVNFDLSHYEGVPRTPQKQDLNSPALNGTQPNSKQRTRNKPRAKNVPTSPESGHPGRHTPPQTTASMKSTTGAAFAGATFHASPAPSALPMPSFFAKPSTDSPSSKPNQDVVQEPSPPTDTDIPTPSHPSSMPQNRESPLDFMFRAHRQEVERQRRESSAHSPRQPPPTIISPLSRSPFEPTSVPKASTLPPTARSQVRLRPTGIEHAELDGTPGRPMGPAFSTPYQERIKAARSTSSHSAPIQDQGQHLSELTQEDPTEALKKFLFSGPAPSGPTHAPDRYATNRSSHVQNNHTHPAASVANNTYDSRTNNLQAMEDDLRRILKLDLASGSRTPERRLFS
ncbi:Fc.00g006520.m01.CDS01 [Cosmosporella sp. VM-42]